MRLKKLKSTIQKHTLFDSQSKLELSAVVGNKENMNHEQKKCLEPHFPKTGKWTKPLITYVNDTRNIVHSKKTELLDRLKALNVTSGS